MSQPQPSTTTSTSTTNPHPFPFNGVSLHVTVTIAPENIEKFLTAAKPVFERVPKEPECLFFEIFHDPEQPGRFKWVEDWSMGMEEFMKNQVTKDYYKPYFEVTEPMFLKPREVEFFHRMPKEWTT